MKIVLLATVAAFALAGTGMASAQTSAGADANVHSSAGVDAKASVHKRKHRTTTGSGIVTRDNNASANGTVLPGKDRLNSKAFIEDH